MVDKKRLTIKDLIPSTDYAVQIRALDDAGETSEWSRKFTFTTTDDNVAPKVPTGFTFVYNNNTFIATWNEVTKNVDESNARILRYGLRLDVGGVFKIIQLEPSNDGTMEYRLTQQRVEALFGSGVTSITAKVRAVNIGEIQGAYTAPITASLANPDAPTNAVVEEVTDGLKISWTAPVNMANVDGYRVYISTSGAGFTPSSLNRVYQGAATSCSYNTTTYSMHYIKIRSYSRYGQESTDLTAQGTPKNPFTLDTTGPSIPGALTVSVDRSGATARALVSWTFTATGSNADIHSFAVRYRKTGDTNWFMAMSAYDARSLYVDLPQPYANYEFQIASIDMTGNYSAWSTPPVTLSAGIPGAPPTTVGLTVAAGLGDLQISWTPSTHDDVTYGGYYEVQVSTNSGFTGSPLTYKTGNTTLSVAGLAMSTNYWVRVRAVDVDGNQGGYSTPWAGATTGVTPTELTDGLPVASSPAATAQPVIGGIVVSWPVVANPDLVKYEVHMSTTAGFTPTLGGATKIAETPGTIVTISRDTAGALLSYTTPYYFRIIAKDADTNSGNAPTAGTVSSGVNPKKSDSADITTIVADQIGTSYLSANTITLDSAGKLVTSNYSPAGSATPAGWMLSSTVVDIQSGVVNFGTLKTGTLTSTVVKIGVGGTLQIDSTGIIKSNTYNGTGVAGSGSSGWALGSGGLDLPGLSITAGQMTGDAINGRVITVNSAGYVQSSSYSPPTAGGSYANGLGWRLDYNGLAVYGGAIYGPTVITNQLFSATHDANSPLTASRPGGGGSYNPSFGINSSGYAVFSGANIYGNTTVGSSASHMVQTSGYSPGSSSGWRISGDGNAYFGNVQLGTSGTLRAGGSSYQTILGYGYVDFSITDSTYAGRITPGFGSGLLYIYPPSNSSFGFRGGVIMDSRNNIATFQGDLASSGAISASSGGSSFLGTTFSGAGITVTAGGINMTSGNLTVSSGSTSIQGLTTAGGVTINSTGSAALSVKGEIHTNSTGTAGGLYDDVWSGGGSTYAYINTNGRIIRGAATPSSIRYKKNVKPLTIEQARVALNLESVTFDWKNQRMGQGRQPGFIAEQAIEAGAELWVRYNEDGAPQEFRYADLTSAHNVLIKELYEEVEQLKEQIKLLVEKA